MLLALAAGATLGALALAPPTWLPGPASPGPGTWPLRPAEVLAGFEPPAETWAPGHRGIDLAASPGQEVVAAADGEVTFAEPLAGRGVVVVDHGGVRSTYEPVAATVQAGEQVGAGQVLGTVAAGTGHCGSGRCLHWGLRRGDAYLDPRLLLGLRTVLLPAPAG